MQTKQIDGLPYTQGAPASTNAVGTDAADIHAGNTIPSFMGSVPGNTDAGVAHSGDVGGAGAK